jgi:hypothetical protein
MVVCVITASEKNCGNTTAAITTWVRASNCGHPSDAHAIETVSRNRPSPPRAEPMNTPENFKTAFCDRFDSPPENFEERVFWSAMHPEVKPMAFLIRCLWPKFFAPDLDCIRRLATAESKDEVRAIINSFQYDPSFKRGFFRGFLRVRISGRRLTRLASRVLVGEG